jgi:hypothetical protein
VVRRPVRYGRVTWADRLVVYAIVGAALVLMLVPVGRGSEAWVRIRGANGFELNLPLDNDETVEVPGPLGTTVVRIAGGQARVVESPCAGQLCVSMGRIDQPGRSIVCVPNEVVVTVVSERAASSDAVTR